jgi:hypothetical protein
MTEHHVECSGWRYAGDVSLPLYLTQLRLRTRFTCYLFSRLRNIPATVAQNITDLAANKMTFWRYLFPLHIIRRITKNVILFLVGLRIRPISQKFMK